MSEELTTKVLMILRVMHPNFQKWYYTRELASLAHVSTWVVSREFSRLVKKGLVKQKPEGQQRYYALNIANPKTRALCQLFESERREVFYKSNRRLSWALEEFSKRVFDFLPQIQSVILFGSAARGQLAKTSDVDLLVLVPNLEQESFNELMKSVDKLAADTRGKYGFQLSAVSMTIRDFEAGFRERKRIAEDVARDGIVLFGEERYYALLGRLIA
jgi:predicted nucleotidyltransferase